MTQTVLVTGANGFIGRHMARHWAARGFTVVGIGHGDWDGPVSEWGICRWIQDAVSLESLQRLQIQPSYILHAAGGSSVSFSLQNPLEDFRRTVETTAQTLEFIRLHSPQSRLIYPSSASVYGEAKELPTSESSPCQPVSVYGFHKRCAEELCLSYGRQFGVRTSLIRLFSVFGPGLRKQLLWDACEKAARGDTVFGGTGDETRDWIHVDDAVALLDLAAQQACPEGWIANGGTGHDVSIRTVLDLLFKEWGGLSPQFGGKSRPGDPLRYCASIERSRALGWRPKKTLEEGVAEYVRWYRAQRP